MRRVADRRRPLYLLVLTLLVSLLGGCGGGGGGGSSGNQLVSIAITPANPQVAAGLMQQLKATGTYADSSTQDLSSTVTWSSGDPAVATVSATSGLVTGVAVGSAAVNATLNSISGSTRVAVTPPAAGWAPTAGPITSRFPGNGFTTTLLPDGTALLAGGDGPTASGGGSSVAAAELYDPLTGAWSATASFPLESPALAVGLADATVLVIGAARQNFGVPNPGAELFSASSPT
jgi:hypothetical protein